MFFMTLFLKKMGIILSASKPQRPSKFSKPILKILSIQRKNILGKKLSPAICSKYVFRLRHAKKLQIFSTKLNMMVQVVKLFTGVLRERCSDSFIGKHLYKNPFYDGGPYHVETSQLICRANQRPGFYMMGTSVTKELIKFHAYRLKKDSCTDVFLRVLANISERFFWENTFA